MSTAASAAILSDKPRWSIITAYNLASNKPYKTERGPDIHESSYTPIEAYAGDLLADEATGTTETADFLVK